MQRSGWVFIMAASIAAFGCGSSETASLEKNEVKTPGPEVAVYDFLKAVQSGDDTKAAGMLTSLARQKTAEMEMVVAPPGSDTASFEVGDVEMIHDDGAYVASSWTDLDEEQKPHTDNIVWVVRREPEGWRIAGMVTKLFDEKLVLNFEDPEDMIRKQQLAEEEMLRRATKRIEQAVQPSAAGDAVRK